MKKTMILTSMALISLVAVGCANEEVKDTQDNQPVISTNMEEVQTEGNANMKKSLIVYFSYGENSELPQDVDASASASIQKWNDENTGNTGIVAHIIQEKTKGDMFSVQTVNKYPSTYNETVNQGKQEHENNIRPELANHITNLDDYDTIFVGYPNWWYDMPMAMYSFFDEYDLSNKTIIPFNTSGGSAFSDTINTIKKLEPNANVIEGFTTGKYQIPDETKIRDLLNYVDYRKVSLKENQIYLPDGMQIDLGAVAKGYIGDEIIKILKANNISSAVINLGGNVQLLGTKPNGDL